MVSEFMRDAGRPIAIVCTRLGAVLYDVDQREHDRFRYHIVSDPWKVLRPQRSDGAFVYVIVCLGHVLVETL